MENTTETIERYKEIIARQQTLIEVLQRLRVALPNGTDLPNETIACPTGEPPPWWGGRHSGGAL